MKPATEFADAFPGRVLIVDDNEAMRMVLGHILRITGYEVETATNGIEGLSKFQDGAWDIVVTDRDMPGMNGEEMAAQIKIIAPCTPVILVTGFPENVSDPDLFEGIYRKPYTSGIILEAISQALGDGQVVPQYTRGVEE